MIDPLPNALVALTTNHPWSWSGRAFTTSPGRTSTRRIRAIWMTLRCNACSWAGFPSASTPGPVPL